MYHDHCTLLPWCPVSLALHVRIMQDLDLGQDGGDRESWHKEAIGTPHHTGMRHDNTQFGNVYCVELTLVVQHEQPKDFLVFLKALSMLLV